MSGPAKAGATAAKPFCELRVWVYLSCALLESARQQKCDFSWQSTTWKSGRTYDYRVVCPDSGRDQGQSRHWAAGREGLYLQ